MNERITIGQMYTGPIRPGVPAKPASEQSKSGGLQQPSAFQTLFQEKLLHLSSHAERRLNQRGLNLEPEQIAKIQTAIDKAAAKGAKDSLILMKDMAFIVNIKNRTIVTAIDSSSLQDNVFTQIDSAVIIP